MIWSYSRVSCYLRCPAQFYFRYIEESPDECIGIALLLGSAVHGAVTLFHARRWQGRGIEEKELLCTFEDQLRQSILHSEAPVLFSKTTADLEAALTQGKSMLSCYQEHTAPGRVLAVEKELHAKLQEGELTGFVDRIEEDEGGMVAVELKTAARAWSQADLDLNDQLDCYQLLLAENGYASVRWKLEVLTKTKTPKLQVLEATRDGRRFASQLAHVQRGVQAGCFPTNRSPMNCSSCSFRMRCADGIS